MEAEEMILLPASSNSGCGIGNNELSNPEAGEVYSPANNSEGEEGELNKYDAANEVTHIITRTDIPKIVIDDMPMLPVSVAQPITVSYDLKGFSSEEHAGNGSLESENRNPICSHTHVSSVSGVKRARITFEEEQPAVHIIYSSLTRASKQKLEELLQQWSEWHAQQNSASQNQDATEATESGEETYFPALRVGMEKSSAVSFWIDNQGRNQQNKDFIPLDGKSVPFYDRGYALGLTSMDGSSNSEGGLEIVDDASRCFNCGSYSHALKECPKPRDNAAVSNARKRHKLRRNQNPGSRNPTRYYHNSQGGKYDGLRPGMLDGETRQLLGLGELDPPPWLNRMREMGYPPGYLEPDDEDQPSGITIFADEEIKEEEEDGEITETKCAESQKKMTVEFPGINAPIPENADASCWAFRSQSHRKTNYSLEPNSREHHRAFHPIREVDAVISPSTSSYPPRYGGYDSGYYYTPSPTIERGRRVYEDLVSPPYSSNRHGSSYQDYGLARSRYETDDLRDYSSRWMDDRSAYRHPSRR